MLSHSVAEAVKPQMKINVILERAKTKNTLPYL